MEAEKDDVKDEQLTGGGLSTSLQSETPAPHAEPQHGPPGSQASSRGEAKDSALLSSRDAGLLDPAPEPSAKRPGS